MIKVSRARYVRARLEDAAQSSVPLRICSVSNYDRSNDLSTCVTLGSMILRGVLLRRSFARTVRWELEIGSRRSIR